MRKIIKILNCEVFTTEETGIQKNATLLEIHTTLWLRRPEVFPFITLLETGRRARVYLGMLLLVNVISES